MSTLVLLRHGESEWNLANLFTGWVDVNLSETGVKEAWRGGELLQEKGVLPDVCHTSLLTRAIRTATLALEACERTWVPVKRSWRLNERHYGGLTGLNKAETAERHGQEQVRVWRRSYDIPPPPLEPGGAYDFAHDRRYRGITPPATESLKTTLERVLPYWTAAIAPRLGAGQTVLIAAHGNSLRAIVKHLYGVSDADIPGVEIPTGNPLLIHLDAQLRPAESRYLDAARATPVPELNPA